MAIKYKEKHKAIVNYLRYIMRTSSHNDIQSMYKKSDDPYDLFRDLGKIHNSIVLKIENSIRNFEMIPSNATIRLEYIKCGKSNCNKCSEENEYNEFHGPYYYAYWRDKNNQGKLKKKYIGHDDPRASYVKEFLIKLRNYEFD